MSRPKVQGMGRKQALIMLRNRRVVRILKQRTRGKFYGTKRP